MNFFFCWPPSDPTLKEPPRSAPKGPAPAPKVGVGVVPLPAPKTGGGDPAPKVGVEPPNVNPVDAPKLGVAVAPAPNTDVVAPKAGGVAGGGDPKVGVALDDALPKAGVEAPKVVEPNADPVVGAAAPKALVVEEPPKAKLEEAPNAGVVVDPDPRSLPKVLVPNDGVEGGLPKEGVFAVDPNAGVMADVVPVDPKAGVAAPVPKAGAVVPLLAPNTGVVVEPKAEGVEDEALKVGVVVAAAPNVGVDERPKLGVVDVLDDVSEDPKDGVTVLPNEGVVRLLPVDPVDAPKVGVIDAVEAPKVGAEVVLVEAELLELLPKVKPPEAGLPKPLKTEAEPDDGVVGAVKVTSLFGAVKLGVKEVDGATGVLAEAEKENREEAGVDEGVESSVVDDAVRLKPDGVEEVVVSADEGVSELAVESEAPNLIAEVEDEVPKPEKAVTENGVEVEVDDSEDAVVLDPNDEEPNDGGAKLRGVSKDSVAFFGGSSELSSLCRFVSFGLSCLSCFS